jgi:CheY-like chemotaxis protein
MIRVLVVEDSPTEREFLLQILGSDPAIAVVGTAGTGEEAIEAVERTRPDIITMDVHMPRMNGFDATRRIMETHPTPIVIVSGAADATDTAKAFRAIESGALAVLRKPSGLGHLDHEQSTSELINTVKMMSEVKVVRRWPRRPVETLPAVTVSTEFPFQSAQKQIRIVAMGASTGGPPGTPDDSFGVTKELPRSGLDCPAHCCRFHARFCGVVGAIVESAGSCACARSIRSSRTSVCGSRWIAHGGGRRRPGTTQAGRAREWASAICRMSVSFCRESVWPERGRRVAHRNGKRRCIGAEIYEGTRGGDHRPRPGHVCRAWYAR